MKTDTEKGAQAVPPQSWSPRIHRASKAYARKRKKILLVDDNQIILKTTSAKLKDAGYEVLTAEDGASAIRQARQLLPSLILLDLNFPPDVGHGGGIPWDGFLILSWLRRTDGLEKVPVIVITGGDLEKHRDRWVEAGVRDIFLKPIDHEALLAALRWALDEEVAERDPTPLARSDQPQLPPALSPAAEPAPFEKAEQDPTPPAACPQPQAPPEPPPAIESVARQKILFIDDTSDWRYLGESYLGERGYEVVTAADPISAMLQISRSRPNFVVLDLNLAGQSATTLLKLLSERHPELPILIYTGMALDSEQVSELLKQGAWGCQAKGSLEELVTTIEKTIGEPKTTVPQSAATPAEKETAKPSPAAVGHPSHAAPEKTEAGPQCHSGLPSLGDLRTATTEELLSAVETARSVTPEPTRAAHEPPVVLPDEVIESAAESILIVEDDAAYADTLRSFLESQSFQVSTVTTGPEAVSLIAAAEVDLILFDLTLPGFRVQQFYEALKAARPHLCSRIIFMTSDNSHPSDDGFVRRLKGISLWKPFPTDWLLEAVQTIRAGSQENRPAAN